MWMRANCETQEHSQQTANGGYWEFVTDAKHKDRHCFANPVRLSVCDDAELRKPMVDIDLLITGY